MSLPSARPILAIVGPTATGKTALGVAMAQRLGADVLSADSRLIYRGLDIGTAKPTLAERGGVPHHAIDVVDPDVVFTVAEYQALARPLLEGFLADGRPPVVVGGTGFYLKALLEETFVPPAPPNPSLRERLRADAAAHGAETLHARLQALDPVRAAAIHPHNTARVIRALEVVETLGGPVPDARAPYTDPVLWVGLTWADRDAHRAAIAARVRAMLAAGWVDEVAALVARFGPAAHALTATHGYPELVRVLQGAWTLAEAEADIDRQVRQYARRQRTWFGQRPAIRWLEATQPLHKQVAAVEGWLAQWPA